MAPIEDIIEEARKGRMFILIDDEDRENEGDLVIPADMASADAVNFMAKHGRGLICLAMTQDRIAHLGLSMMAQSNASRHQTAFTVSIEAREGVTTGISAADRARTVAVAIDPASGAEDIVSPGHVFPLMAREGGVLVRAGHTEAAVDVARLAGLTPAGVICEIMNDDGTMARTPDLIAFAQFHGLKIGTIADLIAYRRRHDKIVCRSLETDFHSLNGGDWRMVGYRDVVAGAEHVALIKGDLSSGGPVPARVHALNILDDVLGDADSGKGALIHKAMGMIATEGRGVVLLLREALPTSLSDRLRARIAGTEEPGQLRDYGIGAQILIDLGISEMILLSNTQKTIIGLDGYGLRVVGQRPIADIVPEPARKA
ncbi:MAG: 3,4-dihydroxy-2-butanone-4-phosphate synthase [Telmatospirillum sp.]|nr:3,4-dihydroxy-2-butanone-4-phosphate synthase [Telmatospirillum sp.]